MSRSRKKVAVFKQKNCKYYKRLVHKRARARMRAGEHDMNSRAYRLLCNPYDICDYVWFPENSRWATQDDIAKARRK